MPPQLTAVVLLLLAGAIFLVGGVASLLVGFYLYRWLYSLLPPILIDAPAVGGAATAIGIVMLLLALAHGVAAVGLARREPRFLTAVIVLCAAMALLAIGWGVAALVSAASGTGLPAAMLPAAAALGVVAAAYGWIARRLLGLRQPPASRV